LTPIGVNRHYIRKMILCLLALLAVPQNFQAHYGFAVKGGEAVQGAILTWDRVPEADNYIVSWTDHPEITNPVRWHDIALTWEPVHIDNAPRRKGIPQYYRVRAVSWTVPQDPPGFPTNWTEPQQTEFLTFSAAGNYRLPFYGFHDFRIQLPAGPERIATVEWATSLDGPWSSSTWQSPKPQMFFRLVIQ
jgi:hypothetical protein